MYSSQTNISSTQKQIWRPFLCKRNFLKKTNCFKSLGEKRLQKVDFIEYIFLPQNFLRRVCLQKPQGRECDREARGKNMLPMVENSHYSIGTSRSSTLLLQYIHWFFVELLQLEALNSPFFSDIFHWIFCELKDGKYRNEAHKLLRGGSTPPNSCKAKSEVP